jgi:hypothetical protein
MESMVAVLNYRDGNEPTSLSRVVNVHRRLGITAAELDVFRDAFLETLRVRLPRRMPAARREEVLAARRDLFAPVVEYFANAMADSARPAQVLPLSRPPRSLAPQRDDAAWRNGNVANRSRAAVRLPRHARRGASVWSSGPGARERGREVRPWRDRRPDPEYTPAS